MSNKGGRPREFDIDEALDRAMRVFWEHGYDGASLTDLTDAMGISRTSMYAAFGNKQDLLGKALQRYSQGPASYLAEALAQPTARDMARAMLTGAVRATTDPEWPAGCLGVQGALVTGGSSEAARDEAAAWRREGCEMVRRRLEAARASGDLPIDSDPAQLATYLGTVTYGIAVQAASGVPRTQLDAVAETAMRAWPTT
ncbi:MULTISPECIES: TetR/AcrR family transcriptional regulator [Catenuloplanes]|uniref:AcrR family transcriptional regulator n=1 Tax=Catenuloplanes niger TaxID=587534 RepID=A0AAE4CWW2_9ACTN|nr:TetR/AcrR family transcriptional regulator [Catenuloplanes niger]MDR7325978.1 AcrR family transcriptional regulator [Catenuloplanes niger]